MERLVRNVYWPLLLGALMWVCPLRAQADPVVARVDHASGSLEIRLGRLMAFLELNPKLSPAAGLEQLIEFEILAVSAEQAGFGEQPGVLHRRREMMVQKLLKKWFEPKWSAETLPESLVRRSYQANRTRFVRPQLRLADHLLVTLEKKRPADPVMDARARALAQQVYQDLKAMPLPNRTDFVAQADKYAERAKAAGLTILGQDLGRFALKGRYDPKFTKPVFDATEAPAILPPFPTRFGYHIVRLAEIMPKKNDSFEQVEKDLRARIVPEVRTMKLIELTDELAARLPKLSRAPGARGLANFAPLAALEVQTKENPTDENRPSGQDAR